MHRVAAIPENGLGPRVLAIVDHPRQDIEVAVPWHRLEHVPTHHLAAIRDARLGRNVTRLQGA